MEYIEKAEISLGETAVLKSLAILGIVLHNIVHLLPGTVRERVNSTTVSTMPVPCWKVSVH